MPSGRQQRAPVLIQPGLLQPLAPIGIGCQRLASNSAATPWLASRPRPHWGAVGCNVAGGEARFQLEGHALFAEDGWLPFSITQSPASSWWANPCSMRALTMALNSMLRAAGR